MNPGKGEHSGRKACMRHKALDVYSKYASPHGKCRCKVNGEPMQIGDAGTNPLLRGYIPGGHVPLVPCQGRLPGFFQVCRRAASMVESAGAQHAFRAQR